MVNYQDGKIYKIFSYDNETLIYIGSTTKSLSQRMGQHRIHYRLYKEGQKDKISSCDVFDRHGVAYCYIELLETFACQNRDELNRREGHHIRTNICVNKNVAGRTATEYYVETKNNKTEFNKELTILKKAVSKEETIKDVNNYNHYFYNNFITNIDNDNSIYIQKGEITIGILNMLGFTDIHDTKIIDVKTFDDNIKMLTSTNIIYKEASHTQQLFNLSKLEPNINTKKAVLGYINSILSKSNLNIKFGRAKVRGNHISSYTLNHLIKPDEKEEAKNII